MAGKCSDHDERLVPVAAPVKPVLEGQGGDSAQWLLAAWTCRRWSEISFFPTKKGKGKPQRADSSLGCVPALMPRLLDSRTPQEPRVLWTPVSPTMEN